MNRPSPNRIVRSCLLLGAAVGLAGLAGLCATDTADAATNSRIPTANSMNLVASALGCNGVGCNGKDPYAYDCHLDAVTPQADYSTSPGYTYGEARVSIDDPVLGYLGWVRMRYSATCNAQWGEVYNNGTLQYSKVALRSTDGSTTYSSPVLTYNAQYIHTTMRATPNSGYRVDGAIQACSGPCDSQGDGYSWVIW